MCHLGKSDLALIASRQENSHLWYHPKLQHQISLRNYNQPFDRKLRATSVFQTLAVKLPIPILTAT